MTGHCEGCGHFRLLMGYRDPSGKPVLICRDCHADERAELQAPPAAAEGMVPAAV